MQPFDKLREVTPRPLVFGLVCIAAADLALTACGSAAPVHTIPTETSTTASEAPSSLEAVPSTPRSAPVPRPTKTAPTATTSEQCVRNLPLDRLIGQTLMPGLDASDMASYAPLFKQYHIGGALLMTAPANPGDGSIQRFKAAASASHVPLLISTDQEGGVVQRFTFPSDGVLPAPQTVARTMSPAAVQAMITNNGSELKAAGVDVVFGPLADVAPQGAESPLGNRVFSDDPQIVLRYVRAYIQGWRSSGIIPTLKHFPGMGKASGNTDNQSAVTPPLTELQQNDFVPYKSLPQTGTAVMVGNQTVPGWFTGPADLNRTPINYLRKNLGYGTNLLVTDALNATAVTNVIPETQAPALALEAGIDIAEFVLPAGDPSGAARTLQAMEADIMQAVESGRLPESQLATAVGRKLAAQHISACSWPK